MSVSVIERSLTVRRLVTLSTALVVAATLLVPRAAQALTDEEIFRALDFSVRTPGSRALGMGGAFMALSDDGTASYTNPAGLGYISRPQFMAELSSGDPDPFQRFAPGTFDLFNTETYAYGLIDVDEEAVTAPRFLSYVHPVTDRVVLSVSRHERYNIERELVTSFVSTDFPPLTGSPAGVSREALATEADLDLLVDTFSASIGVAVHEQLSLGLTVSLARLDMTAKSVNFLSVPVDLDSNGSFDQMLRSVDYQSIVDDDDTQFTFTAGMIWKAHPKIAIGMVYRDGPTFDLIESVLDDGARATKLREYLATNVGVANVLGDMILTLTTPDSYGAGISFGPFFEPRGGGGLLINADVTRVEYTDVLDNYIGGLNNQLFATDSVGVVYEVEDQTEWAVGAEWTWTVGFNNRISVRGGLYNVPDSSIVTSGRSSSVVDPTTGFTVRPGLFDGQGSSYEELHFTLGAGFVVKRGFFEFAMDAAADFSDIGSAYSGTASFKF